MANNTVLFNERRHVSTKHSFYNLIGTGQSNVITLFENNVGIGTTAPRAKLDVTGDIRFSGIMYDEDDNAMWIPGSTLQWMDTSAPVFTVPSGATLSNLEAKASYRYIGNEVVYNFNTNNKITAAASISTDNYTLTLPEPLKLAAYATNSVIGDLLLTVTNAGATLTTTYKAYALVNADNTKVTIRYLNGTTDASLAEFPINFTFRLQGTITYASPNIANNTPLPSTALPGKFVADQDGRVAFNTGVTAAARFDIKEDSATFPGLKVTQAGTGDILQVVDGTTSAMVVKDGGNVGIGTTNPLQKLHVVGNTRIQGDAIVTGNWEVQGTTTYIDTYTAVTSNVTINNASGNGPALRVTQSGVGANYPIADFYDSDVSSTVPALRIADGGNVGVGTANPLEKLHVQGSVLASTQFLGQAADSVGAPSFSWTGDTDVGIYRPATDTLGVVTSGVERMRVDSSGNVGIGTTNPIEKLDVNGTVQIFENVRVGPRSPPTFTVIGAEKQYIAFNGGIATGESQTPGSAWAKISLLDYRGSGADNFKGGLAFSTKSAGSMPIRMVIDNSGNVGIGTTNALTKLYIKEAVDNSMSTQLLLHNEGQGNHAAGIAFQVSGSPELSTYAPKAAIIYERTAVNGVGQLRFFNSGTTNTSSFTASDERMRIASTGNVGIGTNNPQAKLDVNGDAYIGNLAEKIHINSTNIGINRNTANGAIFDPGFHAYQWQHTRSATAASDNLHLEVYQPNGTSVTGDAFVVTGAGNVGIGLASPQAKLDVQGSVNVSGSLRMPNLVAFHSHQISTTTGILKYSATVLAHSSMNNTTGQFTCPVTGIYFFMFSGFGETGNSEVQLIKTQTSGTTSQVGSRIYTQTGYTCLSPQATLLLNSGEKMHVFVSTGSLHFNLNGNFSGYMIG